MTLQARISISTAPSEERRTSEEYSQIVSISINNCTYNNLYLPIKVTWEKKSVSEAEFRNNYNKVIELPLEIQEIQRQSNRNRQTT